VSYNRPVIGHLLSSITTGLNSWLETELRPGEATHFPQLFTACRSQAMVQSSRAWSRQAVFLQDFSLVGKERDREIKRQF